MALFRKLFYRKPPDRLLEIAERVYVFDCCFSTEALEEDEYKVYLASIIPKLQDHFPDASFMVFNFSERKRKTKTSDILSQYGMTVMEYPLQYEGCSLLPLEMIHHFIRSSESWLSLERQKNVLLMNCERGGWPILAFMLSGLLLYRKQYEGEQKTLEMVYRQAPRELFHVLSPVNSQPSQMRYLQYISRRNLGSDWPPPDTPLILDCLILRELPMLDGGNGWRPIIRIYGQDPLTPRNRNPKLVFSSAKMERHGCQYLQAASRLVKVDVRCHVQGDVVLECIRLDGDLMHEEVMFRIMFHTAFVHSNSLKLNRDDVDVLWDAKDQFPKDFRAEVLFLDADHVVPNNSTATRSDDKIEIESNSTEEFFEVEELFSNIVDVQEVKKDYDVQMVHANGTDYIDNQSAWKEDADPPTFQRCKSFGGSQNLDKRMDCNVEAVKDITVDDVTFKTAEKVDSGLQVVKDIVVDYGDKKPNPLLFSVNVLRRMAIKELIDNAYDKLEGVQHKAYGEDTAIRHFESKVPSKKLEADAWRLKYEKLQSTSRKHLSSTVKPMNHTILAKQKTKQPEDLDFLVKQAKPYTLSRWTPHDKESYTNSMDLFYPPSMHTGASATSISSPTKDSYSYSSSKSASASATSGLLLSDTADEQKSNKVSPTKPLCFATEILTSKSQSPLDSSRPLPNAVLHQDPTRPLSPTTLPQTPTRQANTSFLHASSPKSSLSPSSYFHKNVRSPPPAPPPPPPPPPPSPPSNHIAPKSSAVVCGNIPKHSAPPAPPPPPIRRAQAQLPPPRPPPSHGALLSPHLSNATALPPPPPPPPPIQRTAPPHSTQGQQALKSATACVVSSSLPSPICEAPSPPQPTSGPLPLVPSSSQPSGGMSPHPGAKGVSSSTDAKTLSMVRGRGFLRSIGMGVATTGPQRSSLKPLHWSKVTRVLKGSLWEELQRCGDSESAPEFDVSELETLFSVIVPKPIVDSGGKSGGRRKSVGSKLDKVHLIDLRRANNTEIMLTKVRMPLSDMMAAVLSMDESVLDVDQVENLIKFCPTKEEMELLKGYSGDKDKLGKCEQYFLEMMQVPRVESKLRVFSFKIHFSSQIVEFKKCLNTVNSVCQEVKNSCKLKEILKRILCLGNMLNQGTARGSAIGFRLDSLSKLTDTRASNNKLTLMHYLCKVLASKSPSLLDFHLDLGSLEAASKIQLKSLAEEMQAITKGLEKVKQELVASENDGPISETFHQILKGFVTHAEMEVESVTVLYSVAGRNADALALYFGEDPARCPFEQVTGTLFHFTRSFLKAHEENCKQLEMEMRKLRK
ncbi:formin-like protein 20 [Benincasa hispida]|uniref:formin-like protein 20 n=1 Tax=Benincasa hispida TaxID=102211 RepID=UPI00190086D9|nr:formin-like protein 20 [Benincasa hispida]